MNKQEKIAIVTGGGTGIGAATARLLTAQCQHIVICSDQAVEDLQEFCAELTTRACSLTAARVDVTDDAAVSALVERTVTAHGRIDWLVNCAGVFDVTPVFEGNLDRVRRLVDVNFTGSVNMLYRVLPVMKAQGKGEIVNISSGSAILGQGLCAAYAASKAAILHFTKTLAPELAGTGIRANCIAPGAVRTQMTALVHSPQSPEMAAALKRIQDLSRGPYNDAFLEPEDIASIVLFLLSDASKGVQGACIVADQGLSSSMPSL